MADTNAHVPARTLRFLRSATRHPAALATDREQVLRRIVGRAATTDATIAAGPSEPADMLPAARLTDMHACPMVTGIVPHVGGPILAPGAPTVLVGNLPAARVGDTCVCVGPPDVIVAGMPNILIMGQPAARLTSTTAHGGVIVAGLPTVLYG